MRRLVLLAGALVLPVLPALVAAPAFAADNVICVSMPAGTTCNATTATIPAAITAANANALDDTILVGPGTYTDGPYQLNGVSHAVTMKGSGQGVTFLTLPASASNQTYLIATHATVQDLAVTMSPGATSDSDRGIVLADSALVQRVTVDGTGTLNARGLNTVGSQVTSSSVLMPVTDPNSRAVYSDGGSSVTDSVLTGAQGFAHSGATTTDTLSRVTVRSSSGGVSLDGGTINVDDTVIDLGTSSGAGVMALNSNDSPSPKTINADHLTIVGGGANSKGVWAYAASPGGKQSAIVTVTNSIIRGPATSLVAQASNTLAVNPANVSTVTLSVSHSDYKNATSTIGANGAGGVVVGPGNVLDVDPAFVGAGTGDYHLSPGSAVIDKGNPSAGGAATDRDGSARVTDGDGNGSAVRDMGAYESAKVTSPAPPAPPADTTAPDTAITKKPAKRITGTKAKLAFSSTEAGATFQCQLDGGAWKACSSPYKVKVKVGKHTILVRAIDQAGNVDSTPAKATFKRVTRSR